jgi:hypothetical protein
VSSFFLQYSLFIKLLFQGLCYRNHVEIKYAILPQEGVFDLCRQRSLIFKLLFIDMDFSESLICMRSIPNVIINSFKKVTGVCVCAHLCVCTCVCPGSLYILPMCFLMTMEWEPYSDNISSIKL